ncbi:hypothetical protein ACFL22_01050, partial [Patescibacteria group bacterium]
MMSEKISQNEKATKKKRDSRKNKRAGDYTPDTLSLDEGDVDLAEALAGLAEKTGPVTKPSYKKEKMDVSQEAVEQKTESTESVHKLLTKQEPVQPSPVTVGKKETAGVKLPQFEEVPEGDIMHELADDILSKQKESKPDAVVEMSPKQESLYGQRSELFEKAEKLKEKAEQEKKEVKNKTFTGELHESFGSTTLEELQKVVSRIDENTREIKKVESIDSSPITETVHGDTKPKKQTRPKQDQTSEPEFVGTARQFGVKNKDDLSKEQEDFDTAVKKDTEKPSPVSKEVEKTTPKSEEVEKPYVTSREQWLNILAERNKINPDEKLSQMDVAVLMKKGISVSENTTAAEAVEILKKAENVTQKEVGDELKPEETTDVVSEQKVLSADLANIESSVEAVEQKKAARVTPEELKSLNKEHSELLRKRNSPEGLTPEEQDKFDKLFTEIKEAGTGIESVEAVDILKNLEGKQSEILDGAEEIDE